MTWYLKPWCLPGEIMTDMYYPIYAEGLYDALMQVRGGGVGVRGGGGARAWVGGCVGVGVGVGGGVWGGAETFRGSAPHRQAGSGCGSPAVQRLRMAQHSAQFKQHLTAG